MIDEFPPDEAGSRLIGWEARARQRRQQQE